MSFTGNSSAAVQPARVRGLSPKLLPRLAIMSRVSRSCCSMVPSSTSRRRICTIIGGCSMPTGQISMQAPQERQDQSVSASITSPMSDSPASSPGRKALRAAWVRRSRIRSRGLSGAPLAVAGQASWQRPHLVQASRLSRSFHENCAMLPKPTSGSASSPSTAAAAPADSGRGIGRRLSAFASRVESEPSTAIRCFALVQGIAAMKAKAAMP